MKTIETASRRKHDAVMTIPSNRHDKKRAASWRVMGATVAGFPAFLWQLTRTSHN